MSEKQKNLITEKQKQNSLAFIKEVAKYFMDFLETDFHKRKNPKRSIQLRNKDNLLVGLNLNKYPAFNKLAWKAINKGFEKTVLKEIKKNAYKATIPKNLLDLVKLQVERITNEQIDQLISEIAKAVESSAVMNKKDYERALSVALENTEKQIKEKIALPLISDLEQPLEKLTLSDENVIYLMEEELSAILVALLQDKISEIIKYIIAQKKVDVDAELETVFGSNDIKNEISKFFENFEVADIFAELSEIERNKNVLDKKEFYLYFCDIAYNKFKYPIFFIPFEIIKQKETLSVEFDSQVYINKRALEYISQEYTRETGKKGSLKKITERIIYLAQGQDDFKEIIDNILKEIVDFFELDTTIDLANQSAQVSKGLWTKITNSAYICLFDKSDEALVNDYEDILQQIELEDSVLAEAFTVLIDDFIQKNPQPFNPEVEDEWDSLDISERLIYESPIPLNSEQLQIVSAIRRDGCKYVTVEGPPGTGKSHTITAIAFHAILNNQSVLVLSDKKEALDVVEDKITATMNKVRHDKKFQNPVLRLGKTGSTYSQILSTTAMDNIKTHHRVVKKQYESLQQTINKQANTLKEDIEAEAIAYSEIDINEIEECLVLENDFSGAFSVDIEEVMKQDQAAVEVEEFRKIFLKLKEIFMGDNESKFRKLFETFNLSFGEPQDLTSFKTHLAALEKVRSGVNSYKDKPEAEIVKKFGAVENKHLDYLKGFIASCEELKKPVIGYLFKKKKLEALNSDFIKQFPKSDFNNPSNELKDLKLSVTFFESASEFAQQEQIYGTDSLLIIHKLIVDNRLLETLNELCAIQEDLKYLNLNLKKYPSTLRMVGIDLNNFASFYSNAFTEMPEKEFNKLLRYINLKQKIEREFITLPNSSYSQQMLSLEDIVTAQMTHLLDGRVINFYEHNKATARAIRDIIRSKKRFPKEEFEKLKEAFPLILAGIRDYAEYIPLEPEIFDLVIIDEASQVSIAQAFPALLRAKKILILGDKKQFSNVKAAQARSDTNREYVNDLRSVFEKTVSKDATKSAKFDKFNIRTSILEFFEYITNYNTQLMKHFRGYKEIISYSNKYFYQDSLQVMKIRGKPIDEVIKFTFVKHDGKTELLPNTNVPEVEQIILELTKLKNEGCNASVGIITPHTNQQKLLIDRISKLPERDYLYENLHLKIMTFDTCQGEERDIIFYSMVATNECDRLWGVFIKDLGSIDIEEDGKIKAQRLNVGFSRPRECMHFVLSKPIDEFTGSIGEALRHFYQALEEAKKEKSVAEVDEKSKMEPHVLHWFYQTSFWKDNKENIEFLPQFELGEYLGQLDKTYNHPKYKVDFLLIYTDSKRNIHKIIIEYDGFQEHFSDSEGINELNYQAYYSENDLYRQKILEGYGYRFLRINKFNVGKDPIGTLDSRIKELLKPASANHLLQNIHSTIENLQNGSMKECPKCKEIKELKAFQDSALTTGYGRFCNKCKEKPKVQRAKAKAKPRSNFGSSTTRVCPTCGSRMVRRTGRYGAFYGCSKYPYCHGTRKA